MAQYPPQVQQPPMAYQGVPNYPPAQPVMVATSPPQPQQVQVQPQSTVQAEVSQQLPVKEAPERSYGESAAKHHEMRKRILSEMSQVRKLQSQLVATEARKRARQHPAKAEKTIQHEASEHIRTQDWWKKLAKTERSPDDRFRVMLRELGESHKRGILTQEEHTHKQELYRRMLRMWHSMRESTKHLQWRLDHARAKLSKLENQEPPVTTSTLAELTDTLDTKLASVKTKAAAKVAKFERKEETEKAALQAKVKLVEDQLKLALDSNKAAAEARARLRTAVLDRRARKVAPADVLTQAEEPDPIFAGEQAVAKAKIDLIKQRAAEKEQEIEDKAAHAKLALAQSVLAGNPDPLAAATAGPTAPSTTAVMVATSDPPAAAGAAPAAAAPATGGDAAGKVAADAAKAKLQKQAAEEEVKKAAAKGEADAKKIKAQAEVDAAKEAKKAEDKKAELSAEKKEEEAKAQAAAEQSKAKAGNLKAKAKADAEHEKEKAKLEMKEEEANAELKEKEADEAAKVKLQEAEAAAQAKAVEEKKAANQLEVDKEKLKIKKASADEAATKKARKAKEVAKKKAKKEKLIAKLAAKTEKMKADMKAEQDKSPAGKKVKHLAEEASERAHELSRKAARNLRRKEESSKRKLIEMKKETKRVIKAQARKAIDVLRQQAEARGIQLRDVPHLTTGKGAYAQLVGIGGKPPMSDRQKQALSAAYAVGAARRAAKLAWLKVVQKLDQPAKTRKAALKLPGAPSVAADTAMRALVATVKETPASLAEAPAARQSGATSLVQSPMGSDEIPTDGDELSGEAAPVSFTASGLPKMTNKAALVAAQRIRARVEDEVTKEKTLAREGLANTEKASVRMVRKLDEIAKKRRAREEKLQAVNVETASENLDLAKKRARAADERARESEQKEQDDAQAEAEELTETAHKVEESVREHADAKLRAVKKHMTEVLNGEESRSLEWDAALFAPQTKVVTKEVFAERKAKKAAKKALKAAAAKKKEMEFIATQDAKKAKKEQAAAALKAKRETKAQKVKAAMAAVKLAKKSLEAAVDASPKSQGLDRYLDTPAGH